MLFECIYFNTCAFMVASKGVEDSWSLLVKSPIEFSAEWAPRHRLERGVPSFRESFSWTKLLVFINDSTTSVHRAILPILFFLCGVILRLLFPLFLLSLHHVCSNLDASREQHPSFHIVNTSVISVGQDIDLGFRAQGRCLHHCWRCCGRNRRGRSILSYRIGRWNDRIRQLDTTLLTS